MIKLEDNLISQVKKYNYLFIFVKCVALFIYLNVKS